MSAPPESRAERTLERFLADARQDATHHAIRRLLERRPDLTPPSAGLPVLIPAGEDAAYQVDVLTLMAWFERRVALAVEVEVGMALRAGASWRLVAKAANTSEQDARARWSHLIGGNPHAHQ